MAAAGRGGLQAGALVELRLEEHISPVKGTGLPETGPLDLNGAKAQLVEWQDGAGWLACTFSGYVVSVAPSSCRLLTADELAEHDLVLGPSSDMAGLTRQMAGLLSEKGHCDVNVIMGEAQRREIFQAAKSLDEDEMFTRLPTQFEAGYLGHGGKAKVLLLDSLVEEVPEELLGAALPSEDQTLTDIMYLLSPYMQDSFGFEIHSRTKVMLRLPFVSVEDEARYLPPAPGPKEADSFLALMGRKRVCVLHFLGPSSGYLTLRPKAPEFAEFMLPVEPNTLIAFLTDQYDHSFDPSGESVVLQCFFLDRPLHFEFSGLGDGGAADLLPDLQREWTGAPPPAGEPVYVAGLASRDPCGIDSDEGLWTVVRHAGGDGFLEIPYTRFDVDLYIQYDDQAAAVQNGKSYCRHQGHVEGLDIFDASFFNVPEGEAYGMDPEQRMVLETGWLAMAQAGYDRKKVHKDSAHLGVFVGISGSDWRDVCPVPSANGVPETFIANRFSYVVNLKGPSFISNTACSASLVAMHSAKVHLLFPTDPLDGCLVAGISANTSPGTWVGNCAGNMLSFAGRSFSFNASADGYGRGEGCAAGVIKRGEYEPENPETYALLAGTHTNSDGRSASLTAPNGPAQQRLLRAILTETQLEPAEICVYEAHGTGTSLGDPIEVGAVRKVLMTRNHPLMISCSKTNIGHLEGGAGMSSFCKCVMACMHTECAPNQHLNLQNPHLDIEGWPANMLAEAQPMAYDTAYVGVSGFGYGGTNSHALTFARNTVTSRGGLNAKYAPKTYVRRVKGAAAPEIWMEGDSYEDWTTTGIPHLDADGNKTYHIELLPGGKTVWREAALPELCTALSTFQIQGSFNGWHMSSLEAREEAVGLFAYELTLGASGQESFSIVVDYDTSLTLHPDQTMCTRKTAKVVGPAMPPSRDHAWLIKGKPGASFVVELFRCGSTTSIGWRRRAEPEPDVEEAAEEESAPAEARLALTVTEADIQE